MEEEREMKLQRIEVINRKARGFVLVVLMECLNEECIMMELMRKVLKSKERRGGELVVKREPEMWEIKTSEIVCVC